jgi:DNA-directed RNA polymerase subunit RPC12/RpoP
MQVCPKCSQCGDQMELISVYGAKACQCPNCSWKTKPQNKAMNIGPNPIHKFSILGDKVNGG